MRRAPTRGGLMRSIPPLRHPPRPRTGQSPSSPPWRSAPPASCPTRWKQTCWPHLRRGRGEDGQGRRQNANADSCIATVRAPRGWLASHLCCCMFGNYGQYATAAMRQLQLQLVLPVQACCCSVPAAIALPALLAPMPASSSRCAALCIKLTPRLPVRLSRQQLVRLASACAALPRAELLGGCATPAAGAAVARALPLLLALPLASPLLHSSRSCPPPVNAAGLAAPG